MRNRVLQIMVSLVLVLILSSSGICAVLSSLPGKTACQKGKLLNTGDHMTISGFCKIPPCSINQSRLFILPDVSFRSLEIESRSVLSNSSQAALSSGTGVLPEDQLLKTARKIPLLFKFPQIFYLNGILIC